MFPWALGRKLGLWCWLAIWAPLAAAQGTPPPLASYFAPAELQSASLSPSNRWLATVVQPKGERARLVVTDLQDKEPARVVAKFARLDVTNVRWVSDDWLVFGTRDRVNRGGRSHGSGLMSVQRDGERIRLLIKREWDTEYGATGAQPLEANHSFLALGAPGSGEIIVGQHPLDSGGEFAHVLPLAVNVATSARRALVEGGPSNVVDWVFDHQGRPRAAVSMKKDQTTLHWWDAKDKGWRELGRYARLDSEIWPMAVDENDQLIVQHWDEAGFAAISRFDVDKRRLAEEPIAATPGYSGSIDLVQDRLTGRLLALDVLTDARQRVWLTPEMQALQAKADAMLPGRANLLRCGECSKPEQVLVGSYSDRHPGDFLLYQPKADKWQRLGARRPDIDPARMAVVGFERIRARDGADLPVWITRTTGGDAKPRPAVVLAHGGPWSRGAEWAWSSEAQFLASRGYVVIEPEFRGGTGYGTRHYRAGWKQWGQSMQDDVTDALRHAVGKGWVDPKRVCIAGASYGGYATLMGLAKDPDQYRCGVAWVGVSDPSLMFSIFWSDIQRDSKHHSLPQLIGDPVKDAAMLAANSPLKQAARIKAPVLLAYGAKDRRVPIEHGELMREALVKAGNPPEWMVYEDEGHGWQRPETLLDFWGRVETFLARHLK